ncbi:MAG: response regulator [bacterium]|nr:response regulator [bacterium]
MASIRAVLADDEAVILKGLKKLIDWKKLGIEIVGEAKDGNQALQLIEKTQPELVLSDIAMPGLNGLGLLQEIGRRELSAKVIFISGYQEFSYAKDAVRYGAVDYLLKPVEPEELIRAIQKAVNLIDSQSRLSILETTETEDRLSYIFQKINGSKEYAREDLYQQFSSLNISIEGKRMLGVAFRFYLLGRSEKNAKMQELLKFSAANKIQKKLEESQSGFVVKKDTSTCYAILLLGEEESQAEIETRIRRLVAVASDHQNLSIKVGIGVETEDISNLPLAYKTSRFAMELYYFTEEELIWYQDVKKDFRESFEDYQECFQNLLDACLHHPSSVENELKKIFSVIRNLHFGNRFAALNRCNLMMADLIQTLCEQYLLDISWVQEGEACMEQIRLLPTYRQTCEAIRRFFYNMCEQIHLGGSSEHKEIVRIRQYIQQHFGENLTLEWMAQTFGMNSFYFSSYFKKNMGKNFKNYLTDLRMEEAEKLLLHTDYKAYEIAEKIGYKNVRQFNENFNKKYGKSPSEYRKEKTEKA